MLSSQEKTTQTLISESSKGRHADDEDGMLLLKMEYSHPDQRIGKVKVAHLFLFC